MYIVAQIRDNLLGQKELRDELSLCIYMEEGRIVDKLISRVFEDIVSNIDNVERNVFGVVAEIVAKNNQ